MKISSHWDLLFKKLQVWLLEFVSEISFSKNCRFDSCGVVINPKLGQKVSKPVFHVPMMIGRWESMVKGNLRWSIPFWNDYLKIKKSWHQRFKLVFHVPMLIDRWKTKVKGTLRWIITLYMPSLKILKFWLYLVTSSAQSWVDKGPLVSCTNVDKKMNTKCKRNFETILLKSWNSSPMLWCNHLKTGSKRLKFVYYVQLAVKILKSRKSGKFLLKVHIDLVFIFLLHIIFDISVCFHFGITVILLSPFAQDLQIRDVFYPILTTMTSQN